MKTVIILFISLISIQGFNVYAQSSDEIQLMQIGYAIKDFQNQMTFNNAKIACQKLGKQWSVPTYDQFEIIQPALVDIGETSSEGNYFWCTKGGKPYTSLGTNNSKVIEVSNLYSVRCVRRLRPSEMGE